MGEVIDVHRLPVGKASVALIAEGDRIVDHVRRGNPFEPQSRRLWGEWCEEGGVVLDVGAYSGLFAIGAALLGCTALAFEPMPFNADRFVNNRELNGVNPALGRVAVSDRCGEIIIRYKANTRFTSGASLMRKSGDELHVKTITIDSLDLPQVTAIKIDVERAEPLVLCGAYETLRKCKPKMLVESLGDGERAAILATVPGYRLADVIDTRNLVLLPI